ncbi:MAG: hypothetical protein HLX50_06560 [Alteromonadaceae bacterium]|nr:hypothetical protein [Alteromonadaceae bacterium]
MFNDLNNREAISRCLVTTTATGGKNAGARAFSDGEFIEVVESQLGIHERAAQRMMKAAIRYLSPALQSKATTLSVLGNSKLLELMKRQTFAVWGLGGIQRLTGR